MYIHVLHVLHVHVYMACLNFCSHRYQNLHMYMYVYYNCRKRLYQVFAGAHVCNTCSHVVLHLFLCLLHSDSLDSCMTHKFICVYCNVCIRVIVCISLHNDFDQKFTLQCSRQNVVHVATMCTL